MIADILFLSPCPGLVFAQIYNDVFHKNFYLWSRALILDEALVTQYQYTM